MLITFSSPVHSDVTMFGDIAKQLLKMMGQSGVIPGAIAAEDMKSVLEKFKKELGQIKEPEPIEADDVDEKAEPPVRLSARAFPLIEMLTDAVEQDSTVMWYERET